MAFFLAICSAGILGIGDFFGGLVTKRAGAVPMVILLQIIGAPIVLGLVMALPPARATAVDLAWGALAGLAGGIGIGLLYRGLATGAMSAVAPVTAVCAAIVPVPAGLLLGERVSATAALGILLALVAIGLMSRDPERHGPDRSELGEEIERHGPVPGSLRGGRESADRRPAGHETDGSKAMLMGIAAGGLIGAFYVLISRASPTSGLWPLVASRCASLLLYLAIGLAGRRALLPSSEVRRPALAGAILDALGTALYVLAVQRGPLMIVAVLTSLYPASTILLATLVLGERLRGARLLGLATGTAAIVLMVTG